jgi:hypothetical protein
LASAALKPLILRALPKLGNSISLKTNLIESVIVTFVMGPLLAVRLRRPPVLVSSVASSSFCIIGKLFIETFFLA